MITPHLLDLKNSELTAFPVTLCENRKRRTYRLGQALFPECVSSDPGMIMQPRFWRSISAGVSAHPQYRIVSVKSQHMALSSSPVANDPVIINDASSSICTSSVANRGMPYHAELSADRIEYMLMSFCHQPRIGLGLTLAMLLRVYCTTSIRESSYV